MRKTMKGYFSTLNMLPNVAIYFLLKTVNTDLVVIEMYAFQQLPRLRELWIEFRTGKMMKFIPVHEISKTFGPLVCYGQLFFHAFSGCDTPSSSCEKSKNFFFESWKNFPEIKPTLQNYLLSTASSPSQTS